MPLSLHARLPRFQSRAENITIKFRKLQIRRFICGDGEKKEVAVMRLLFCGNISLFSVEFLSLASAYAVDVAFKVAVIYQLRQNILFKGRHGAGVKTELFVK